MARREKEGEREREKVRLFTIAGEDVKLYNAPSSTDSEAPRCGRAFIPVLITHLEREKNYIARNSRSFRDYKRREGYSGFLKLLFSTGSRVCLSFVTRHAEILSESFNDPLKRITGR